MSFDGEETKCVDDIQVETDAPMDPSDFVDVSIDEPEPIEMATPLFDFSDIIRDQQVKVEDALVVEQASTSKKRKLPAQSVSLWTFVNIIYNIFSDVAIDNVTKKMQLKKSIADYIGESFDSAAKRPKDASNIFQCHDSFQHSVMNVILTKVFCHFEAADIICLFPKETLKFFLATHSVFISPRDFSKTDVTLKTERRSKSATPLTNGNILYEYTKGFDTFMSNMARSDHDDIKALKFIVENKISAPKSIYNIINSLEVSQSAYTLDSRSAVRSDYVQILMTNAKHMVILITSDILMCFDGNQFVTPQINIERDLTTSIRQSSILKPGDYVLLEVAFAIKSKVIDVLKYRLGKKSECPASYNGRIALLKKILPHMTPACISQQGAAADVSYIQKPMSGFGQSFMYHKSHLISAAVGVSEKTVVLAFLENEKTLVVKTKASIYGSATCSISAMALRESIDGAPTDPKIFIGDVEYNIVGDLTGVKLFERAIILELKDGNRLGALSSNPISKASDHKPIVVKKADGTLMKDIERRLDNEEFSTDLVTNISTAPMTEEQRAILKRALFPNIDVSFDNYASQ